MGIPNDILHARLTFLSHFPHNQRATATNFLLQAIRAGCNEPNQVVGYALETACRRCHLGPRKPCGCSLNWTSRPC